MWRIKLIFLSALLAISDASHAVEEKKDVIGTRCSGTITQDCLFGWALASVPGDRRYVDDETLSKVVGFMAASGRPLSALYASVNASGLSAMGSVLEAAIEKSRAGGRHETLMNVAHDLFSGPGTHLLLDDAERRLRSGTLGNLDEMTRVGFSELHDVLSNFEILIYVRRAVDIFGKYGKEGALGDAFGRLGVEPTTAMAYALIADGYAVAGKPDAALQWLEKGFSLGGSARPDVRAETHAPLAWALGKIEGKMTARERFRKLKTLLPDSPADPFEFLRAAWVHYWSDRTEGNGNSLQALLKRYEASARDGTVVPRQYRVGNYKALSQLGYQIDTAHISVITGDADRLGKATPLITKMVEDQGVYRHVGVYPVTGLAVYHVMVGDRTAAIELFDRARQISAASRAPIDSIALEQKALALTRAVFDDFEGAAWTAGLIIGKRERAEALATIGFIHSLK